MSEAKPDVPKRNSAFFVSDAENCVDRVLCEAEAFEGKRAFVQYVIDQLTQNLPDKQEE